MDFTLTPPPPGQPHHPTNLSLMLPSAQQDPLSMDLTLTPLSYIDLSLSPPNSTPAHIPDSPPERAVQQAGCSNPDADKVSGSATAADVLGSETTANPEFLTFCNKEIEPPLMILYVTNSTPTGEIQQFTRNPICSDDDLK
jgi:hypothetical protein